MMATAMLPTQMEMVTRITTTISSTMITVMEDTLPAVSMAKVTMMSRMFPKSCSLSPPFFFFFFFWNACD